MAGTGGYRPNSGRKSARDERLREKAVSLAIGKYVKALENMQGMNDKEFQRIKDMCLPVMTKDMATKLAGHKGEKLEPLAVETQEKINNAIKDYINDRRDT